MPETPRRRAVYVVSVGSPSPALDGAHLPASILSGFSEPDENALADLLRGEDATVEPGAPGRPSSSWIGPYRVVPEAAAAPSTITSTRELRE